MGATMELQLAAQDGLPVGLVPLEVLLVSSGLCGGVEVPALSHFFGDAGTIEQLLETSQGQADRFALANPHPKNHPQCVLYGRREAGGNENVSRRKPSVMLT